MGTHEAGPRDDVSLGHRVEQVVGKVRLAEGGVEVDQGVVEDEVRGEARGEEEGVDLVAILRRE